MDQQCEKCLHFDKEGNETPCYTCRYTEHDVWSNFTPKKKDLNQVLREKLGYAEPSKPDAVQQPSHYMLKPGLEVRDVLELLVNNFNFYVVGVIIL